MASNYPDEGRSTSDGGAEHAGLPFRAAGADHPARTEARAELRDRETYYAELRLAVDRQNRSVPGPGATHLGGPDTWTRTGGSSRDDNRAMGEMADTWT